MKRLIAVIFSTMLAVSAHAAHDWVYLEGEGLGNTIYYWSDIQQDTTNSNLKTVRVVFNKGEEDGSFHSILVLNCANATVSFRDTSEYSQYFARGEVLHSSTRHLPFEPVRNTPAIFLYDIVCTSR